MKARLESIGAYLPECVVTMKERVAGMTNPPPFDLEAITGIQSIRHAGPNDDCLSMGVKAAQEALSRSQYKPEDIDIVISCSISRYTNGEQREHIWEPPLSLLIKDKLGLKKAINFDVSNACAGMFSGVLILERMIRAGTVKNGLVISGEYITPIAETAQKEIVGTTDPQFGSMTVGDSAAAVILDRSTGPEDVINYFEIMTCAAYAQLCIGMASDKNAGPALYTINAEMHKKERLMLWPRFHLDFYKKNGGSMSEEKFDHIIHHQVGTRFVEKGNEAGTEMFGVPMPEPLNVVQYAGNTSSTAHFLVLHQAIKAGKVKKGQKTLIIPAASGVITGFLSLTTTNVGA